MNDLLIKLQKIKEDLLIEEKLRKIKHIEKQMQDENIWKDWESGNLLSQDLATLKKDIEDYELLKLYAEEGDESGFYDELKNVEIKLYLSGKHDRGNCILSIYAGQGGTDAMDWVQMLQRMYVKYAEKKLFQVNVINESAGEEAGLKSVSSEIIGLYSYGLLKNESGVHRLVRLSPFNSNNLRQTSFALVEVIPLINEDIEVILKPEDIKFESFRSSGSGGQNVNKVSTAVRLTHLPTGITVECQEERSQGKNRDRAEKILRSKIYARQLEALEKEKARLKGKHIEPGWGNQIRNYVLHPYKQVKDLRTDMKSNDPEVVLDGYIDSFIEASLNSL